MNFRRGNKLECSYYCDTVPLLLRSSFGDFVCRWDVARLTSQRTAIYRPNPPSSEEGAETKKMSFGAFFSGNYHKLPNNKVVAMTWEAAFFSNSNIPVVTCFIILVVTYCVEVAFTSSPPKIMPVKPKMYLLASFTIPANCCVNLSAAS